MKDINIQAQNKLVLVGKLLDATFNTGTFSDGRAYERANITLRVTQTYGGKEETSDIPVSMFASQYTQKGTLNPGYKSIQDLKTFKSVQNYGLDVADTVRVTGATLRENAFVTRAGQLVNGWQINGSFINKANMAEAAGFVIDIFIMDMHPEEDREGDSTGRLIVKGGIVQYGGKLDVLEFIVEDPQSVDYIERNWNPNDTVTIKGRFRVTTIEENRGASESSWGEDIPETTTRYVRELILTKGDDEGKDEEFAYDPTEIKKAFNVRKAMIEQLQIDAKTNSQKSASKSTAPQNNKYSWE